MCSDWSRSSRQEPRRDFSSFATCVETPALRRRLFSRRPLLRFTLIIPKERIAKVSSKIYLHLFFDAFKKHNEKREFFFFLSLSYERLPVQP